MTIKEEIMNKINHLPTERIPWFGDLSYYYGSLQYKGELDAKYQGTQGELQFYKDLGVGMYLYAPFVFHTEYTNGVVHTESKSAEEILERYDTPLGSITSRQKFLPESFCYAYTKHFVETIEDLRVMACIFENMRYKENYEEYNRCAALWGNDGLAMALAPISVAAMQKLLTRWAGVETTIDLFYDHTDEFEEILHRIESAQLPVFDIIAKSPAEVVAFPENLSSEITGSRFFKEFNLPYYQKVNRILHKEGKKTAIHIDGTLHPCLSMLSEAGFDIAEAVTPYPCGDIRISDLRNAAGPDIILWGGIPGALFTEMFTDKEFEDHVREVLALSDDKFVLGVADQVPTDGLWHRIAAVRRLVDEKRPA
jgi:hypothetical protein